MCIIRELVNLRMLAFEAVRGKQPSAFNHRDAETQGIPLRLRVSAVKK